MVTNKLVVWLGVISVALIGALCMLAVRIILPINPLKAYIPIGQDSPMDFYNWTVGQFQPVYLYSFNKGNDGYIRTVYRDAKNKIRFLDLFVGNKNMAGGQFVSVANEKKELQTVNKVQDYNRYIGFGRRIKVGYLRNVTTMQDNISEKVVEPTEFGIANICNISYQNCISIKIVKEYPDLFWNFEYTGVFSKGILFPVMTISNTLFDTN